MEFAFFAENIFRIKGIASFVLSHKTSKKEGSWSTHVFILPNPIHTHTNVPLIHKEGISFLFHLSFSFLFSSHFQSYLTNYADVIIHLLTIDPPLPRALLPFSSNILLSVVLWYLSDLQKVGRDVKVPDQRLFSSIFANLKKFSEEPPPILLSNLELQRILSVPTSSKSVTTSNGSQHSLLSEQSFIVFSCGHHFDKLSLEEELVYMRDQIASFEERRGVTLQMTREAIRLEYDKPKSVNLACPRCVLQSFFS